MKRIRTIFTVCMAIILSGILFNGCDNKGGSGLPADDESVESREIVISEEVRSMQTTNVVEYDGILFKADTVIAFTSDGKVRFGFLAESVWIDGVFYTAGSFVEFDNVSQSQ